MERKFVIADCKEGYHHPDANSPTVCVPDNPPVALPVPTLADTSLLALAILVVCVGAWVMR